MGGTAFDLAKLIWPVESEAFFRDTWEKQPLAVPRRTRATTAACSGCATSMPSSP
jgi:hypothetical protein